MSETFKTQEMERGAVNVGIIRIEFRSDDVKKMILLKLWDFFNC